MHQVRRADVFPVGQQHVVAGQYNLTAPSAPHSHDFLELAVVTAGRATHVSAAGELELTRGSAVLLRPGDWHGYADCADLTVYNVYIGPEVLTRELAWLRADPGFSRTLYDTPDALRLEGADLALAETCLEQLTADRARRATSRAVQAGLLLCVLGGAMPQQGADVPADPHPEVTAAARRLEHDLTAPWTLERLAAPSGLSPGRLARLFARRVGVAPMAYLGRLRAERAAALLIETDLPVAAIGRRVGWPDPNYTSRRFRHHYGLSPAQYRERFRAR
ncbi:AraC family transcriptional regulator [Streptomyces sp. WAC 06738]|uniref:AraC family transcriptional regulator n=1 Tax=Streptomyces sp. WAC 06738 TaxID=2203210 RepID=UPI000F6D9267|nr:AraC family transcriptional regulator [Streptomyces sp. WAC 06738]AZM49595.1 AraC family transcriptional regulator [Streptomyces sp. WAC 06738]